MYVNLDMTVVTRPEDQIPSTSEMDGRAQAVVLFSSISHKFGSGGWSEAK